MSVRVSDFIAEYLEKLGVTGVFLVSGGGMMHLLDAVARRKSLQFYCNHHEQCSAFAAEGYARESRQLGVCYATSGPGATNLVTGIISAWQDSSPVLFITGQSKVSQTIRGSGLEGLRQFGCFEADILPIVASITKYSIFLSDPKKVKYCLQRAIYLACNGRTGPVLIDIPLDVQGALIEPDTLEDYVPTPEDMCSEIIPDDTHVDTVVSKLLQAQRPLILAGHGISCAGEAVIKLFHDVVTRAGVPVATTQLATDIMPYNHPLYVGHPGPKGDRAGNFSVQSADVIIVVGASLHVLTTGFDLDKFAPNAYLIQVDPDPMVLKRTQVGVDDKIQCRVDSFLKAFKAGLLRSPLLSNSRQSIWKKACTTWKIDLSVSKEPHKHEGDSINYYDFIDTLSHHCESNTTVVSDAGSAYYTIGQAFRVKKGQRVIICGALGQMGYALAASSGASVASPERKIVCVTGDGSLQMNIHELAVISKNKFNIKIFVVNNGGYVSIRNTQNNFFGGFLAGTSEDSGVFLPNHEKLADAYSLPYLKAESRETLSEIVMAALAMKGPVICEIYTPTEQAIIPTVTSKKLDDGSMISSPLHDMSPFLSKEDFEKYSQTILS
jgi:acetolactate synthase I/II/III large subunit